MNNILANTMWALVSCNYMVLVCKFTIELRSDKHTIFTVMDATEVDSMLQT